MIARLLVFVVASALAGMIAAAQVQPVSAAGSGVVFSMTNGSAKNKVMTWSRAANGGLSLAGKTATGGRGTGGQLNNQGGLALSGDAKWLYVVNAGGDSLSVFRVNGTTLTRTDVEPSLGDKPISVAVRGTLVYVLNAGGNGNIRGFRLGASGLLSHIAGAARPLSGNDVVPAQIGFTRDGSHLIVSERATDRLTRYRVTASGDLDPAVSTTSAGAEPFGFDFAPNGTLVVSEAGNHVNDGSSASSYRFNSNGAPLAVSGAVATTETAACWTAITPDGKYAYVTNTPDHSITGFALGSNGSLTILDADGRTAATGGGSFPIDLDSSVDSNYLYVLAAGTHRILVYAIAANGSLTARPGVGGLPGAANGLVAR